MFSLLCQGGNPSTRETHKQENAMSAHELFLYVKSADKRTFQCNYGGKGEKERQQSDNRKINA